MVPGGELCSARGEWSRADTDRRHQFNFLGTVSLHRWLNFGVSAALFSAPPFNITTGKDENCDGMAIDNLRWYREFRFQPSKKDKSSAITFSADAFNIFNRVNYAISFLIEAQKAASTSTRR